MVPASHPSTMTQYVCRIRWRKGEPLGLSVMLKTTFLDLPPEIRHEIYRYSLVAAEPISIWQGLNTEGAETYYEPPRMRGRPVKTIGEVTKDLGINLLYCCRLVSQEAAAVLYQFNVFEISGLRTWSPPYMFLRMIGAINRSNLRSLSIQVSRPQQLWQFSDGVAVSCADWPHSKIVALNPEVETTSDGSVKEGPVEDTSDPAIPALFRLLAGEGQALTVRLHLPKFDIPGVCLCFDEHSGEPGYWGTTELPDKIERYRQDATSRGDKARPIQVLWSGFAKMEDFMSCEEAIQNQAWIITERNDEVSDPVNFPFCFTWTRFTLIRRPLGAYTAERGMSLCQRE